MRRNDSLDVLRGIAVLLVIAVHCAQSFPVYLGPAYSFSLKYGAHGVELFFIISGYTMLLTFRAEPTLNEVMRFYIRRCARIVPLFWAAGGLYLVKALLATPSGAALMPSHWAPNGVTLRAILLTFSFLHWTSPTAFNSVIPGGWSIAVEMQFYLLFPVFAYLFYVWKRDNIVFGLVGCIYMLGQLAVGPLTPTLAATVAGNEQHLIPAFFYFWLPRQIVCFGYGMLLYRWRERGISPAVPALLLLISSGASDWGLSIFFLFLFSVFTLTADIRQSALALIGGASYSMYLLHFAVISIVRSVALRIFGRGLEFEIAFVLVAAASLFISIHVTQRFIEAPSIKFGKWCSDRCFPKREIDERPRGS